MWFLLHSLFRWRSTGSRLTCDWLTGIYRACFGLGESDLKFKAFVHQNWERVLGFYKDFGGNLLVHFWAWRSLSKNSYTTDLLLFVTFLYVLMYSEGRWQAFVFLLSGEAAQCFLVDVIEQTRLDDVCETMSCLFLLIKATKAKVVLGLMTTYIKQ